MFKASEEKNYFDFMQDDYLKSYEGMVYAQIGRCMWIGSLDTSYPGKQLVQDERGNTVEIIREDLRVSFINSVKRLYDLVEVRLNQDKKYNYNIQDYGPEKEIDNNYLLAQSNFKQIMKHIHTSGIFGHQALVVVWDWKLEREKLTDTNQTLEEETENADN